MSIENAALHRLCMRGLHFHLDAQQNARWVKWKQADAPARQPADLFRQSLLPRTLDQRRALQLLADSNQALQKGWEPMSAFKFAKLPSVKERPEADGA